MINELETTVELLFKITRLQRDVATLHTAVSDLFAKNIALTSENESLRQRLVVATGMP